MGTGSWCPRPPGRCRSSRPSNWWRHLLACSAEKRTNQNSVIATISQLHGPAPLRGFFTSRAALPRASSVSWPISKQDCSHEPTSAKQDWLREQSDWPSEIANGKDHGQGDTASYDDNTGDDVGSGHRA